MNTRLLFLLSLCAWLVACGTPALPAAQIPPTPITTPTPVAQCAALDIHWGNWPAFIESVDRLMASNQACGPEPLHSKKYAAQYNYGVSLEESGDIAGAMRQYQAALFTDPRRAEARQALTRLDALPKPTPPLCLPAESLPPFEAGAGAFVRVAGQQLTLDGEAFTIRGVNYYPRHAPWQRFLTEARLDAIAEELDLLQAEGFNTLRIFLWYEPLFSCLPEQAEPVAPTFQTLDALISMARERNLKLIITLNDGPDLQYRPLYTDWAHYNAQTAYIVQRYADEPAILAWDVRNGADVDIGDPFSQAEVMAWLAQVAEVIRAHAPRQLITAGWTGNPAETAPYVDFVAFQHWEQPDLLPERIAAYQAEKPLVLIATGQSSIGYTDAAQADYLGAITVAAETNKLAGWLIWTAFDFAPEPGQTTAAEHHFGLWHTELIRKPALESLPLQ